MKATEYFGPQNLFVLLSLMQRRGKNHARAENQKWIRHLNRNLSIHRYEMRRIVNKCGKRSIELISEHHAKGVYARSVPLARRINYWRQCARLGCTQLLALVHMIPIHKRQDCCGLKRFSTSFGRSDGEKADFKIGGLLDSVAKQFGTFYKDFKKHQL